MVEPHQIDLESIADLVGQPAAPPSPDSQALAAQEEATYDQAAQKTQLESLRQDIRERKRYAMCLFVLMCVWLAGVLLLTAASHCLEIDTAVLVALITGLSVNVLGLFIGVVNYLFHRGGKA